MVFKGEIEPTKKGLRELVQSLGIASKLFIFEAGNQLKWIALYLKKLGCQTHVVHPNTIKWINESSGKTDKIDARKLAELGRADMLPGKVHIVEGETRKIRELNSARLQLQSKRVALINTLRGYLKQEELRFPEKFFSQKSWRDQLVGLKLAETQKLIVEKFMEAIDAMHLAELGITAKFKDFSDKRTELLETIPGIGKTASRTLVAGIDKFERFEDRRKVAKYSGLTPRIYQSGSTSRHGRINSDGRHEIRNVLVQSAHAVMRTKSFAAKPLQDFYWSVEKRRGNKRALIALCRKLVTAAYGVVKSGKAYDPFFHAAKPA